jgi:hypothetical protein
VGHGLYVMNSSITAVIDLASHLMKDWGHIWQMACHKSYASCGLLVKCTVEIRTFDRLDFSKRMEGGICKSTLTLTNLKKDLGCGL